MKNNEILPGIEESAFITDLLAGADLLYTLPDKNYFGFDIPKFDNDEEVSNFIEKWISKNGFCIKERQIVYANSGGFNTDVVFEFKGVLYGCTIFDDYDGTTAFEVSPYEVEPHQEVVTKYYPKYTAGYCVQSKEEM